MADSRMEICEIQYTSRAPTFGAMRGTLIARATGSSGTYMAESREGFKIKKNVETVQSELNSLINDLVADGWQALPGGRPLSLGSPIIAPSFQRPER